MEAGRLNDWFDCRVEECRLVLDESECITQHGGQL
jgi:hypothetical protein